MLLLRSQLEAAGLTLWMDVGQMGGGSNLNGQIYDGIQSCQVFLCCLSPLYAVSESTCCKEANLADLLHKPILPVMIRRTPWPPPGSLALILAQLIYVDLAGNGGHGGAGRDAEWSFRVKDLVNRIRAYIRVLEERPSAKSKKAKTEEIGAKAAEVGGQQQQGQTFIGNQPGLDEGDADEDRRTEAQSSPPMHFMPERSDLEGDESSNNRQTRSRSTDHRSRRNRRQQRRCCGIANILSPFCQLF